MPSDRFTTRCKSLFDSQRVRARQKKTSTGRITKKGWIVPFSQQEFTTWFLQQFGGAEGGVARCPYCKAPIDAYSCVIDHMVPLKRGGSPGLENLTPSCAQCNDIKGQLLPVEFEWLREQLYVMAAKFGQACVADITSRLEKATKLAQAYNQMLMGRKREAAKSAVVAISKEDDF